MRGDRVQRAALAHSATARQTADCAAARQGQLHLCGRDRLPGLEDKPARGNCDCPEAMAATLAAVGGTQPAASAAFRRGDPLMPVALSARAWSMAADKALMGWGFRNTSQPATMAASPMRPDEASVGKE